VTRNNAPAITRSALQFSIKRAAFSSSTFRSHCSIFAELEKGR
jgi:hypothetical protein